MSRSILQPFSTTYSVRMNSETILLEDGTDKREALAYAQRLANTSNAQVWVIEHDEGLRDFGTIVVPNKRTDGE
jgi:nanoRNase/pAp phosphatase (c-di-AMP/oligoRNAs hydrolase)